MKSLKGLYHAICNSAIVLESCVFTLFNSKNSGPVLLFKTIFRHENYFLSSVTTDGKDEHELKFEKVWQTVLSFNAMLAETHL